MATPSFLSDHPAGHPTDNHVDHPADAMRVVLSSFLRQSDDFMRYPSKNSDINFGKTIPSSHCVPCPPWK